jgi:peptide/nickel transport system permease protein
MKMAEKHDPYWIMIWRQFCKHKLGKIALYVVVLFILVGIYAPFLAASKPFVVQYHNEWYFTLFRYLFYQGYYTKRLDIFFNLLIFTFPAVLLIFYFFYQKKKIFWPALSSIIVLLFVSFIYFSYGPFKDPAFDQILSKERQAALASNSLPSWNFDLKYMSPYAKLNLVLRYSLRYQQHQRLQKYVSFYNSHVLFQGLPTLWQSEHDNEEKEIQQLKEVLASNSKNADVKAHVEASIHYIIDRRNWLETEQKFLKYKIMPFIRPFHWEDDAGGDQSLNQKVPFWELTRINRKDLASALIFGVRISLVVGLLSVGLALMIGLPIGALAGYYGGTFDIIVSRLLEIWEAMPTFFMLLMVVAIMQSKSIFLVIAIIGIFGWTSFSRYIRGEFFKQRNLSYIEACHALGFNDTKIIFSHILPNAIPPVLTLLPFSVMGAITSEAGLSFLGLGEEGSCSWGVLMDEGRSAFPSEAYLLWPPAILLTTLLVAIALVGDAFRDALDPKMQG